jgi:anti-anti-sigma factor
MTDQARFATRRERGVVVVDVQGEIDILNAADLRTALSEASEDGSVLVVSLSNVSYFDSQTLEILVDFSKRVGLTRQRMVLVAERSSAARRLLDVSGISQLIPTVETIDDALRAAGPPAG